MSRNHHHGPRSLSDLFMTMTWLALQGFGGIMAVVQLGLVDRKRWLTEEEFVEEWAVAQIMPGPNVVNLCLMIGGRYFGVPGALAAIAGLMAVPLFIVLLLALVYVQYGSHPIVLGALRGMGAVAAGLIIASGLRLFSALKSNSLGMPVCILLGLVSFAGVALLRLPLLSVLLGPGLVGCLMAYRRLRP